ncbi:branched-chain amino acid ABC transporter permease [Microvirga tunisiensis]|uniref:Branched-chain amino acid ABC transporter permease n=2 Tax=Pannonibacter tanglangensis TaxID=2750084 RepID=A0ABW9ZCP9_9HYPH|nr:MULTISPECIES: branched-chain amino acid ABC transporter permease [unclassified Pannonibacter]NBN62281.1 branched-chain amino acid ABC transporter permease [Pannonibacter sp. XCT-34]NBN77948.1 branched-chain amino acid ABC transporter permease [Pannonibacter sp. XCT-53]
MRHLTPKAITLLALVALILVAPLFFPSSFYYRVGTLMFINGLAVTGLVILIGYAGQISLGHAGFCGIGAYACALAPVHLGLPPVLAMLLGAVISGALAYLVGRPILRLKGHYLAVATLGFGILIFMVLSNESWLTGGPDGMQVEDLGLRALLKSVGISVPAAELWYWLSALVLLLGAALALNLHTSSTGRALRSLHDSEIAARTVGVDVAHFKLMAFVISAVYASVSGSLLAMMNKFVSPDIAGFLHSVQLVTMTVLGGAGSVFGAITGASILTALPQGLTIFHDYEHIVLGLIMMLVMIFLREGLVPSLIKRFSRRQG